jgi:hypothetical protein
MLAEEVRSCVSIPIRMKHPDYLSNRVARGRTPRYPLAFTLRVPAASKAEMRAALERAYGHSHSMIYSDYPGFAAFGRSISRRP